MRCHRRAIKNFNCPSPLVLTALSSRQAFEFSEWFLLQIHEHVHSCQYGNFLGNNQRQREELQ